MYYLPYNKDLKKFSRRLRQNSTLGEVLLWNHLKRGQMCGYTFNRQKPLDRYIVDFYCKKLNLVIEIDGMSHDHKVVYLKDIERQKVLEEMGLNLLRFEERQVKREIANVLAAIETYIHELERTIPLPP